MRINFRAKNDENIVKKQSRVPCIFRELTDAELSHDRMYKV